MFFTHLGEVQVNQRRLERAMAEILADQPHRDSGVEQVGGEPSGGGSRETDWSEATALKRSGRVKEPEEATESTSGAGCGR